MTTESLTQILKRNADGIRSAVDDGLTTRQALQRYVPNNRNMKTIVALWSRIQKNDPSAEEVRINQKPASPRHAAMHLRRIVRERLQPDESKFEDYLSVEEFRDEVLRAIKFTNATTVCQQLKAIGIPVTAKRLNSFYHQQTATVIEASKISGVENRRSEKPSSSPTQNTSTSIMDATVSAFEREEKTGRQQTPTSGTRPARDQREID